jgi:hypothetical protein
MGLFDLFKKKADNSKQSSFVDETAIETTLRKASAEPAYRAEFYKNLLSEKLIVLTDKSNLAEGVQTVQENTNINLMTLTDGKIPVFTSTSKIFDKGIIKEQVPFLEMKGEDLFNMATGATFILNPYSDYGKELLPDEIKSLINGTILTDNHRQITIEKETPVQIGQPANYPTEMVNSLKTLFKIRPNVKAAYLGWIFNPAANEAPHLIFALDIESDKQNITNEAGLTVEQFRKANEIIDFIQIETSGGLSEYFLNQTNPFYVR